MARCKYGRKANGRCKRKPRKARAKKCRYGKLRSPRGRRVCKKKK